jgi:sterol desaturase/sphingolipid hydroxylase (fatty acid hydroxylase superfamily)
MIYLRPMTEFLELVKKKLIALIDLFDPMLIVYYFTIVIAMLIFEWLILGWEDSSLKKIKEFKGSVRTDFVYFLIDAFNLYNLVAVVLTFGVFHIIARVVYEATHLDLVMHISNPYLQFAAVFVFSDLKNYWSHRIFHRYMPFWKLHEFHHSATEFCMLTRYRGHFVENAVKRLFDVIPFAILGAPIESYFAVKVLSEIHQIVLHSSFKSDWGWVGKYLLVSPAAHRIHHSVEHEHYDKNFGNTFIFWDRMFGTYHPAVVVNELGVTDNPYNKSGVVQDVITGIRRFIYTLFPGKTSG